jgi:hypothetical protein
VALALTTSSQKLEVNTEGTKVRRTTPLPDYDETTTSRYVNNSHYLSDQNDKNRKNDKNVTKSLF